MEYALSFKNTYKDTPFRDLNWQLVRLKGSKKAFLWTYEMDGYIRLNVKVDPEWRDYLRGAQIIRFPGGSSNTVSAKYSRGIMSRLVKDVEARGFLYCDWNVSSGDAGSRPISTQQVVQNVTEGMQKNNVSIVLQHDIKEFSVNAVEQIIQWGLAEGYTFLPLSTSSPMSHHGVNN